MEYLESSQELNEWLALLTDTVPIHLKRVWISEETIISQKMVYQTCNLSVLLAEQVLR